jgi:hypothetical protein
MFVQVFVVGRNRENGQTAGEIFRKPGRKNSAPNRADWFRKMDGHTDMIFRLVGIVG